MNRLIRLNPSMQCARLYPRELARALQDACNWPLAKTIARIDDLTDQAAAAGLARARWHDSGWVPRSMRIPTIRSLQSEID